MELCWKSWRNYPRRKRLSKATDLKAGSATMPRGLRISAIRYRVNLSCA
jgi:hypothetical protein